MFVCLQKLLYTLIIHSYKTNPSFLPCPWNLRTIGPSDFKISSWLKSKTTNSYGEKANIYPLKQCFGIWTTHRLSRWRWYHRKVLTVPFWNICLFVWSLSSHSRIFHSFGDVTVTGKGLKILTYAWHLWLLSSEGSLAYDTYCDTEHPFIIASPRIRDTHTL